MTLELTNRHVEEYERDGFTIVPEAFTARECDGFVAYMLDLQAGSSSVEGYRPQSDDDWDRLIVRNCHNPASLAWMTDRRLREPLRTLLGDEPDGVQSMFLFRGSEQRRHQDAYHLPGCMSAWVALEDVGARNGSIHVQVGSHRCPQLEKRHFRDDEQGRPGPWSGWDHVATVCRGPSCWLGCSRLTCNSARPAAVVSRSWRR